MRIVLRLGGSVIASPVNPKLIDQYAKLLTTIKDLGHKVIAVVGGGALAREFIAIGNEIGLGQEQQDWLAIQVSRLYALLFTLRLGKDRMKISTSIGDAVRALREDDIVVMGGLAPGMTTDAVAARTASEIKAELLVKATDQDGIYDKDPAIHKDARKLDRTTFSELKELLEKRSHEAGLHQVLDPIAIDILQNVTIKAIVVNGFDPENVIHAIEGKDVGTTITQQDINKSTS